MAEGRDLTTAEATEVRSQSAALTGLRAKIEHLESRRERLFLEEQSAPMRGAIDEAMRRQRGNAPARAATAR